MNTDVVVIGAGAAGLTAGLVLARARHHVTVIDDQTYRNATVDRFHGFPTRDATAPRSFRSDAVRELRSYGVRVRNNTVVDAHARTGRVELTLDDRSEIKAAAMVLAAGVSDELPAIDGLAERWGKSVFNCPFCDGWEQRDQPVVVIDAAPGAEQLADLVRTWTQRVTVVAAAGVLALTGDETSLSEVVLSDGTSIPATAAFIKAPVAPRSTIARQLGCDLDETGYVITNESCATSHPLVWSAGDIRRPPPFPHQVVLAAADGSTAAISIHRSFVSGALGIDQPSTLVRGGF